MASSKEKEKSTKSAKPAAKKVIEKPVASKPVKTQIVEKKAVVAKTSMGDKKVLKVPAKFTYGTGKRKSAIAKVWLFQGTGQIVVNNLATEEYFQSALLIENATKPLEVLSLNGKYDAKVTVQGGGKVGQAEACKLGVARALLELNETFREKLREHGFLSRDPRVKERKKYGRKRARKGFQFRKR